MIQVGDTVNVSLANGGVITGEVMDIPGNNLIYWTIEAADGTTWVVGPSLTSIEKIL